MFTYLTAGESHGPGLVAVVEGLPAGMGFSVDDLRHELARRRLGYGRSPRMGIEKDEVEVIGGIRHGRTLGSPVAVVIRNTEHDEKWSEEMSPHRGEPKRRMTTPRPGHADLAGMVKYDTHDARNILERASARETAARTVVGYLAKTLLGYLGIAVFSHVVEIGKVRVPPGPVPEPDDLTDIDASPVRCFHPASAAQMEAEIQAARDAGDTLGGVVEIVATDLPTGLGSHVHWDRKLDARLAHALMSVQAIKGVEIGDGFDQARTSGSMAHDEIVVANHGGLGRETDRAGGTEGGMSIGGRLRVRAAMKPIATVMKRLRSVDVDSGEPTQAFFERSDICAVPRAGVVCEQVVAIVLAQEAQRMFGGDTIEDLIAAHERYRGRITDF